MAFEVDADIINQTTKCPHGFKCLKDGAKQVCKAEEYVKGNGLFIHRKRQDACPYLMTFGYGYMCHCPTRVELYTQHGV